MSYFILKIIAIISMIFDHLGYIIFGNVSYFNYIGRIAFPIFAFGISEGYKKTKNPKKYFFRLLIFAIVSQIPYVLYMSKILNVKFNPINFNIFNLNIGFTLLLGFICITLFDKFKYKSLGLISVFILSIFAEIFPIDYGWYGILLIFAFYLFYDNKKIMFVVYTLLSILKYIYSNNYILFIFFSMIPLLLIYLYNQKRGKNLKYFFYIFYPLHFIILYIIRIFLFN